MTYDEIKEAILKLEVADQKRLILDVFPQIWQQVCTDDACLDKVRSLVDEDTVRSYRDQHMNGI